MLNLKLFNGIRIRILSRNTNHRFCSSTSEALVSSAETPSSSEIAENTKISRHPRGRRHIKQNVHIAVDLMKKLSWAKFDETVEIAINLGVDPRKSNQIVKVLKDYE